jgi:hypothetical protein
MDGVQARSVGIMTEKRSTGNSGQQCGVSGSFADRLSPDAWDGIVEPSQGCTFAGR